MLGALIVPMKHGKRRSAFRLISTAGTVKSSNLVLEREEEDSGNGDQSGDGDGGREGGGSGSARDSEALPSSSAMPTKANTLERDIDKDSVWKKSKKEKEDNKKKEKAQKKDGNKVPALALATDPLVEVIGTPTALSPSVCVFNA